MWLLGRNMEKPACPSPLPFFRDGGRGGGDLCYNGRATSSKRPGQLSGRSLFPRETPRSPWTSLGE